MYWRAMPRRTKKEGAKKRREEKKKRREGKKTKRQRRFIGANFFARGSGRIAAYKSSKKGIFMSNAIFGYF